MNFESMNETDVREELIRPLLHKLGYRHGTEANIRTEQTFRYAKTFLGRKKANDPDLVGRADYILDVASVGRWVVEAKPPTDNLGRESIEQAHTYAAHPEVNALFFLITNGRSWRLYRTGYLEAPTMAWETHETDEVFLALNNLVGPDAIRKKMKLLQPDVGKPLGKGIPSQVDIIGGFVRYEDHKSNHQLLDMSAVNGLELPVTSGRVFREDDGRIHAIVKTAQSMPFMAELNAALFREDGYDFYSSDAYISVDRENPTIFQNIVDANVPVGTAMTVPGLGEFQTPMGFRVVASTEAIGFVDGELFLGSMQLSYEFFMHGMTHVVRTVLQERFGPFPPSLRAEGGGIFEVKMLERFE